MQQQTIQELKKELEERNTILQNQRNEFTECLEKAEQDKLTHIQR